MKHWMHFIQIPLKVFNSAFPQVIEEFNWLGTSKNWAIRD